MNLQDLTPRKLINDDLSNISKSMALHLTIQHVLGDSLKAEAEHNPEVSIANEVTLYKHKQNLEYFKFLVDMQKRYYPEDVEPEVDSLITDLESFNDPDQGRLF